MRFSLHRPIGPSAHRPIGPSAHRPIGPSAHRPNRLALSLAVVGLAAIAPTAVRAQAQATWTNWTAATTGDTTGTATGTLNVTGHSPVTVSYTGDVTFAYVNGVGPDYWLPASPFISPMVPNAPPDSDFIALTGGPTTGLNTLTFSSPVLNPVLAINSLGDPNNPVSYIFSNPFDLLSQGAGYFGAGTLTQPSPNVLRGQEGDGTIRFDGTFTSISWTVPQYEHFHGFTVGLSAPVPEASTTVSLGLLLVLGLGGVVVAARRKKA